jgi:multidrug resistance efflux pump
VIDDRGHTSLPGVFAGTLLTFIPASGDFINEMGISAFPVTLIVTADGTIVQQTGQLDEAKLTHKHPVATAGLERESLEFELQTRRLQRDRQQLLVEDLERRVGELAVKSPVDGVVGRGDLEQFIRARVEPNQPLFEIITDRNVTVAYVE